MKKYRIVLPALFLILLTIGGFYFLRQNNPQKPQAPVSTPPANKQIELEVISEIPEFSAVTGEPVRRALVEYLNTIHYWEKGVIYGTGIIEGTAVPKQLLIILTQEEQENFLVLAGADDNARLMYASSTMEISGDRATLKIYADPQYATAKNLRSYLLEQLFLAAAWPRETYTYDTPEYNTKKQEFINGVDFMLNWYEKQ